MNVVIVHYHLNRGGVARVIANHAEAIDSAVASTDKLRLVVLHGGRREGWTRDALTQSRNIESSIEVCPALDYDDGSGFSKQLSEDLPACLAELGLSPEDTVVHVHNHALGKNHGLPEAVCRLAEAGYGLLLQIHDFVEDYRPANYRRVVETLRPRALGAGLYPLRPEESITALLNERDLDHPSPRRAFLRRIVCIWFPTRFCRSRMFPREKRPRERSWRSLFRINRDVSFLLYPRSMHSPQEHWRGTACCPIRWRPRRRWSDSRLPRSIRSNAISTRLGARPPRRGVVPCRFEVGAPGAMTFSEAMAAADGTITSSVAEGFGMAFLECWQLGLSLAGRNLPDITQRFLREHGIVFPNTYCYARRSRLRWLDRETLRQRSWSRKRFRKTFPRIRKAGDQSR